MNNKNIEFSSTRGDVKGLAAIFDMDGTLIDNTPYHYKAWQSVFAKHNMAELTRETYLAEISGVPIINTIKRYFGDNIDEAELKLIVKEKQQFYEEAFQPYLKPINGLENFLAGLKAAGVKMAVATSSTMDDVNFIFETIPIRQYFDAIVIGSMVSEPKPSPQIFLKAAEQLNTQPKNCVVFEDSIMGLTAGNNAGMKVVGITTAHSAERVSGLANLAIADYTAIDLKKIAALFD
jgi:beta-phosphoglucomutase